MSKTFPIAFGPKPNVPNTRVLLKTSSFVGILPSKAEPTAVNVPTRVANFPKGFFTAFCALYADANTIPSFTPSLIPCFINNLLHSPNVSTSPSINACMYVSLIDPGTNPAPKADAVGLLVIAPVTTAPAM